MTRIDFYILPDTTLDARLDFACKLAETIVNKGYRLHIHAQDDAMASAIDDHLWVFRPDAYLPHALLGSEQADNVAITIGHQAPPVTDHSAPLAMLNLHSDIPEWFSRFERVAEIINQHQDVLTTKRKCWQVYKERGYPVTAHQLGGKP
ncbi:DNA polymerase III subunit chi [Halomonas halocynthiae]|uniref:DNA polymerase III subunit chi n=1 Tax=Halomonas halocynthiae TaxID=176290 RepID=UPI0004292099|nr:DNA polymerase III subunit chi [Halomonas halocynthiae]